MNKKVLIIALGGLTSLFSCKNQAASDAVERYCNCLSENVNNPAGRMVCIDMMDSLQDAFANQPRVLNQIVEETEDCQLSF
ncbi:hypothetical protein SAMN05216474_1595 [Lishizhenia tianjinensis]|uniref:Lipoprotein n=1 Tax=Lishizhenia tianjinensis TaxID=477690 RepID=A0A1I6ZSU7_9FLAO|nr:hypothetical protein [Lishizhenia tianjinensis]SFT65750.1 hypothetical protein SAMN05216474_1595 [Lishizhenia tianjinensis]